MGLTRLDLENLRIYIAVGNVVKISRGYASLDFLITSVFCSTSTHHTNYKLMGLQDDTLWYELTVVEAFPPRFILKDELCTYFLSLDNQDEFIIEEIIDPETDKILWENKQIDTVSYNKINNCPIYVNWDDVRFDNIGFNDDRVMAHIFTPKIKGIYANENNRTLVIKWETDEVTKVTCDEEDTFDLETGLARAIAKYVLGNNYNAGTIFNKYLKSIKLTKKDCQVVELAKEKKTQKKTRLHS